MVVCVPWALRWRGGHRQGQRGTLNAGQEGGVRWGGPWGGKLQQHSLPLLFQLLPVNHLLEGAELLLLPLPPLQLGHAFPFGVQGPLLGLLLGQGGQLGFLEAQHINGTTESDLVFSSFKKWISVMFPYQDPQLKEI